MTGHNSIYSTEISQFLVAILHVRDLLHVPLKGPHVPTTKNMRTKDARSVKLMNNGGKLHFLSHCLLEFSLHSTSWHISSLSIR